MPRAQFGLVFQHIRRVVGSRGPEDATDGELLSRFVENRDEAAFTVLAQRYGALVLAVCRRVLGDQDAVEDAFQATFLVLAHRAASIRKQDSVGSWLHGVAYRTAVQARVSAARQRRRECGEAEMAYVAPAGRVPESGEIAARREAVGILDEELQRLPEKLRAPLVLCYLQDQTNEQAAAHLRCPVGSIYWRLTRAREQLRRRLEQRGVALSMAGLTTVLASSAASAAPTGLIQSAVRAVLADSTMTAGGAGPAAQMAHEVLRSMRIAKMKMTLSMVLALGVLGSGLGVLGYRALADGDAKVPPLTRTAKSGLWSAADTWEGGKIPAAKARVQIRQGHNVTYDVNSDQVIRSIHVAGALRFAPDRNTRLDVGLIKVQPGDDASENGFDCDAHAPELKSEADRPIFEVGTPERPIDPKVKALIRLTHVEGLDKETCPAIICCGGKVDFHGASMSRTWVKLGATAKDGEDSIVLGEAVTGWNVGDRLIITAAGKTPNYRGKEPRTEERVIQSIEGSKITLDRALERPHLGDGDYLR